MAEGKFQITSDCTDKDIRLLIQDSSLAIGNNNKLQFSFCICPGTGSGNENNDGSGDGNGGGNGGGDGNSNGNGSGNNNGNGGSDDNGNNNGNGNGNGDGDGSGDGNGDDNGGNGGDNGNDGDGDEGGNDDDQPGDFEVSLLGSTANDAFYDILALDDGYAVLGLTSRETVGKQQPTVLLATYNTSLALTSQSQYVAVGATERSSCLVMDKATSRYTAAVYYELLTGNTWYHNPVIFSMNSLTKEVEKSRRWNIGYQSNAIYNLISTPEGFTGSASLIGVGNQGRIVGYDSDLNMLKAMTFGASGKTSSVNRALALQDQVLVVGYGTGNFESGVQSGMLIILNDILEQKAVYAYGYEKNMELTHIIQTKQGIILGGQVINKVNGSTDIILLGLDRDYKLVNRSILTMGTGNELLTSLTADASGNLLLCGTTTSAGAGSTDVFLIRVDPEFSVTKELVFGTTAAETYPSALFNKDGSVTFVGATSGAGAGGSDAFIATVSGNWSELTGSLNKYPAMRINAKPGVQVEKEFSLQFNDKTTYTTTVFTTFAEAALTIVADTDPGFIVDPNAVVEL